MVDTCDVQADISGALQRERNLSTMLAKVPPRVKDVAKEDNEIHVLRSVFNHFHILYCTFTVGDRLCCLEHSKKMRRLDIEERLWCS